MDYTLQTGIKQINAIKPQKTQLLCERILQGMIESKLCNQIFTEAEMTQLCTIFNASNAELLLVIDSIIYIYRQCALVRIPKKILAFFQEIGLDEAHVILFNTVQ